MDIVAALILAAVPAGFFWWASRHCPYRDKNPDPSNFIASGKFWRT